MTTAVWTPACMDPAELAAWEAINPTTGPRHADRPCADCLLGFAAEMRAVGRCNGTPDGCEEDPEMETTIRATAQGRRLSLDLVAPCATCLHEPICRLRIAAEELVDVETTAPELPAGLRLALTATVECDHYLRAKGAKPAPTGHAPRVLSDETRAKMRASAIAARARKTAAA